MRLNKHTKKARARARAILREYERTGDWIPEIAARLGQYHQNIYRTLKTHYPDRWRQAMIKRVNDRISSTDSLVQARQIDGHAPLRRILTLRRLGWTEDQIWSTWPTSITNQSDPSQ